MVTTPYFLPFFPNSFIGFPSFYTEYNHDYPLNKLYKTANLVFKEIENKIEMQNFKIL